ncbi:MFS transporter [Streptomyces albipurpureus]|uniref:MFS transporter n=1 Tax=Streptomyces albipurpureus TaxID=2897419 RepID=A0ABT0V0I2_9ACTN|nr:MFS transporter [Streptomyces sp. CWNU-1]MCM2393400.1 MFS transporter [Streptomyces sp. CWNU-1]
MTTDQHADAAATPASGTDSTAVRRRAWIVLAVLVCLMFVNFADKVVVGLSGVEIKEELGIGPEKFGVIQSSFFWLFAVGAVLGGWLGGKVKARWLLAGIATVWAITLAPMVGQVGFTTLIVCRVILGFAEGPTTALVMQVVHSWFPAHKRALPSSLIFAGAGLGPLVAAPVLTWVITTYSWHMAFAALAGLGALVAVLWLLIGRDGPAEVAGQGGAGRAADSLTLLPDHVPLRKLFGTGTVIGIMVLFVASHAITSTKISWLPLYLREGLGYDATTTGRLVALPYLGATVAVVLTGVVSQVMTKRGMSNRATRGWLAAGLVLIGGFTTITFSVLDRGAPQMILIVLSACLNAAGYGVAYTGLADVVPPKQRGVVTGIVIAVHSVGSLAAPLVMGVFVGAGETAAAGYSDGFLALGITLVVGAAIAITLINPERDVARLAADTRPGQPDPEPVTK